MATTQKGRSPSLPLVEPILPMLGKEPFDHREWSFEFKYDGFRGMLHVGNGKPYFLSKAKKRLPRFDMFAYSVADTLRVQDCILDGEIVVLDEAKRPQFYDLLKARKEPQYVVFDILWLNGRDLRDLPLTARRKQLAKILPKASTLIILAYSVKGRGCDMFSAMCKLDLEGMIAKRFKDPYHPDTVWYKIKNKEYSQVQGRAKFFHRRKD